LVFFGGVVILTGFKYLKKISESRNRRIRVFKKHFFSASKNRTTGFRYLERTQKKRVSDSKNHWDFRAFQKTSKNHHCKGGGGGGFRERTKENPGSFLGRYLTL
jgi:hypothetical protein